MNTAQRDKILAPYLRPRETGGITHFEQLPLEELRKLIKGGFVEMRQWNEAPTAPQVFLPFMTDHQGFTAHGYFDSSVEPQDQITVEGLEKDDNLTRTELIDFARMFRWADDFEISDCYAYCWYD
jgi:hypothetical protein